MLKTSGKPINDSSYPYFALINLWVIILGDNPEQSPLAYEYRERMNEIVYNKIPPVPSRLYNTKDRQ